MDFFTKHFLQLLRSKNDVFIIWQDDIFLILSIFHTCREFLHGWIHGLTAGDNITA